MLAIPDSVRIVEMLPRDGFQYYDSFVSTDRKVELIDRLARTGVDELEITSFSHPDDVPTLRDADEVGAKVDKRDDVTYRALVPNVEGMRRARRAGVDKVNMLGIVCPEARRRILEMDREENLEQIARCTEVANRADITVELGLGMSFFSPYQGEVPAERTTSFVEDAIDRGVDEVTLAATAGMADPGQVDEVYSRLTKSNSSIPFGLHQHCTNGMALANVLVALQHGVVRFDTSVCGLGGGIIFPEDLEYIGNLPTERLVYMLEEIGVDTGIDLQRIRSIAREISEEFDVQESRVLQDGTKSRMQELFSEC